MQTGNQEYNENFEQRGKQFLKLPVGSSAQRPISHLLSDMMRYNSALNRFEIYRKDAWDSLLTEENFNIAGMTIAEGANVTKQVLNEVLKRMSVETTGSIFLGYTSYYYPPNSYTLPKYITNKSGDNGSFGVSNLESDMFTATGANISIDVDFAAKENLEANRFDYLYEGFTSIKMIQNLYSGGAYFLHKSDIVPLWTNAVDDPNYGKFRIFLSLGSDHGYVGVNFNCIMTKYKNFDKM